MYKYHFKLDRVVDGDTIDAFVDLGFGLKMHKRIRMVGINTPETRTRDLAEKEAGLASKKYLKELFARHPDAQTIVKTEKDETGKYGRLLGTIYINGVVYINVNAHMLDGGYAFPYGEKWGDAPPRSPTREELK